MAGLAGVIVAMKGRVPTAFTRWTTMRRFSTVGQTAGSVWQPAMCQSLVP